MLLRVAESRFASRSCWARVAMVFASPRLHDSRDRGESCLVLALWEAQAGEWSSPRWLHPVRKKGIARHLLAVGEHCDLVLPRLRDLNRQMVEGNHPDLQRIAGLKRYFHLAAAQNIPFEAAELHLDLVGAVSVCSEGEDGEVFLERVSLGKDLMHGRDDRVVLACRIDEQPATQHEAFADGSRSAFHS